MSYIDGAVFCPCHHKFRYFQIDSYLISVKSVFPASLRICWHTYNCYTNLDRLSKELKDLAVKKKHKKNTILLLLLLLMCNRSFFSFLFFSIFSFWIGYFITVFTKWLTDFSLLIYQTIIIVSLFSFLKACCSATFHLLFYPYKCAPSFKHTSAHMHPSPPPITTTTHTEASRDRTGQILQLTWEPHVLHTDTQNRHRWHVSPMLQTDNHNRQAGRQRDRTGR